MATATIRVLPSEARPGDQWNSLVIRRVRRVDEQFWTWDWVSGGDAGHIANDFRVTVQRRIDGHVFYAEGD